MTGATRNPFRNASDTGRAQSGWVVRVLNIAVFFTCLAACSEPPTPPEEALRLWLQQGHEAVEQKERRTLVKMISPAYTDARGNTREKIENLFRVYFFRQHNIALLVRIEELHVIDDSAAELVLVVAMAGTNDGVFGFSADAYRFEMELEFDGDDWLLIAARWGEIGRDVH
ncbi:MAG: hypothetical protein IIA07_00195 [Proteobacteria bacterium]|nr:hypothetical protein [Pseudomonadota bacterium]